jgi:hypothetical protein
MAHTAEAWIPVVEGDLQSLLSTHILLADIALVKSNNLVRQVQPLSAHAIKGWSPPPSGVMKIHVDRAIAKVQNPGAIGVICRDERGHFQGASAVVFRAM